MRSRRDASGEEGTKGLDPAVTVVREIDYGTPQVSLHRMRWLPIPELGEYPGESFLDDILCCGGIPGHEIGQPQRGTGMLAIELSQPRLD
jgi:hypothetical protein